MDGNKQIVKHDHAHNNFRLGIGRTLQIHQHLGHNRRGGAGHNAADHQHFLQRQPHHPAEQQPGHKV
ncbi:hypothetical protein D3C87_2161840 [compost metagenome]